MTKNLYGRCLIFFAALIAILCLSGCSTPKPKKKDGPPKHIPAHLLKIPDAIPRVEPLSRYGNRFGKTNIYTALKKRYRVMSTSRGYRARGTASWYGTQFHGRKTSNGERYDMFAMTAAHPTLPLPTYAKVTNLHNGKSVIVKINDRGPFHANRLIDLSYVAAAKLGILGRGTGQVEVVSIDPRDHGHTRHRHPSLNKEQTTLTHRIITKQEKTQRLPSKKTGTLGQKKTKGIVTLPKRISLPSEKRPPVEPHAKRISKH